MRTKTGSPSAALHPLLKRQENRVPKANRNQQRRSRAGSAATLRKFRDRTTAFHEAGHTVVGLYLGYIPGEISIAPSAEHDSHGHVTHGPPLMYDCRTARERKTLARQMILASYAGLPAQRLVDPTAAEYEGNSDDENAFWLSRTHGIFPRWLSHVGDDRHHQHLARLKRESSRLVFMLRTAIEKLAEALLERTTLTGEEADMEYVPHSIDIADTYRKLRFLSVAFKHVSGGDEAFQSEVKATVATIFQRTLALLHSAGRGLPKGADEDATCPYGSRDDGSFRYELHFSDGWSGAWEVKDMHLQVGIRRPGHDEWEVVLIELPARES